MKKFETPELEVVKFDVADIITTSSSKDPGTIMPDDDFGE